MAGASGRMSVWNNGNNVEGKPVAIDVSIGQDPAGAE